MSSKHNSVLNFFFPYKLVACNFIYAMKALTINCYRQKNLTEMVDMESLHFMEQFNHSQYVVPDTDIYGEHFKEDFFFKFYLYWATLVRVMCLKSE